MEFNKWLLWDKLVPRGIEQSDKITNISTAKLNNNKELSNRNLF